MDLDVVDDIDGDGNGVRDHRRWERVCSISFAFTHTVAVAVNVHVHNHDHVHVR